MIFIKHRFTDFDGDSFRDFDGVEVDVRELEGNLYIGHDMPEKRVSLELLKHPKVWAHAKDERAYKILLENNVRCFMHDKEFFAEVSDGHKWTFNPNAAWDNAIFMDIKNCKYPVNELFQIRSAAGICSDCPDLWKAIFGGMK